MLVQPSLIDRVRTLVADVVSVDVPSDQTDLIDSGLIDSLTLITLIAEIELEFQAQLALEDLDVEQFRTVQRIAQFLSDAALGAH